MSINFGELRQRILNWDFNDDEKLVEKIAFYCSSYTKSMEELNENFQLIDKHMDKTELEYLNGINYLKNISIKKFVEHIVNDSDKRPVQPVKITEEVISKEEREKRVNEKYRQAFKISVDAISNKPQGTLSIIEPSDNFSMNDEDGLSVVSKFFNNKNHKGVKCPFLIGSVDFSKSQYLGISYEMSSSRSVYQTGLEKKQTEAQKLVADLGFSVQDSGKSESSKSIPNFEQISKNIEPKNKSNNAGPESTGNLSFSNHPSKQIIQPPFKTSTSLQNNMAIPEILNETAVKPVVRYIDQKPNLEENVNIENKESERIIIEEVKIVERTSIENQQFNNANMMEEIRRAAANRKKQADLNPKSTKTIENNKTDVKVVEQNTKKNPITVNLVKPPQTQIIQGQSTVQSRSSNQSQNELIIPAVNQQKPIVQIQEKVETEAVFQNVKNTQNNIIINTQIKEQNTLQTSIQIESTNNNLKTNIPVQLNQGNQNLLIKNKSSNLFADEEEEDSLFSAVVSQNRSHKKTIFDEPVEREKNKEEILIEKKIEEEKKHNEKGKILSKLFEESEDEELKFKTEKKVDINKKLNLVLNEEITTIKVNEMPKKDNNINKEEVILRTREISKKENIQSENKVQMKKFLMEESDEENDNNNKVGVDLKSKEHVKINLQFDDNNLNELKIKDSEVNFGDSVISKNIKVEEKINIKKPEVKKVEIKIEAEVPKTNLNEEINKNIQFKKTDLPSESKVQTEVNIRNSVKNEEVKEKIILENKRSSLEFGKKKEVEILVAEVPVEVKKSNEPEIIKTNKIEEITKKIIVKAADPQIQEKPMISSNPEFSKLAKKFEQPKKSEPVITTIPKRFEDQTQINSNTNLTEKKIEPSSSIASTISNFTKKKESYVSNPIIIPKQSETPNQILNKPKESLKTDSGTTSEFSKMQKRLEQSKTRGSLNPVKEPIISNPIKLAGFSSMRDALQQKFNQQLGINTESTPTQSANLNQSVNTEISSGYEEMIVERTTKIKKVKKPRMKTFEVEGGKKPEEKKELDLIIEEPNNENLNVTTLMENSVVIEDKSRKTQKKKINLFLDDD